MSNSYRVNVYKAPNQRRNKARHDAYLEEAIISDMLLISLPKWTFDWSYFWEQADFACEAIIKLSYGGEILGLIRMALYPYYGDNRQPEYLEILHLESIPNDNRSVNPVGFWLLWYACAISIDNCQGDDNGVFVKLDSLQDAIHYYRDKVKMDEVGWTTHRSGEDVYAFSFTKQGAEQFCLGIEKEYGIPVQI